VGQASRTEEPWEARRVRPPQRLPADVREAREDARLLLWVVRARLREGTLPVEHLPALDRVAEDERVQVRRRRMAAELAARVRLGGLEDAPGDCGPPRARRPRAPRGA
jgi:hypothetical protein